MDRINRISARLRECFRGQTKIDFAMILLASAVVVYVGCQTIGKGSDQRGQPALNGKTVGLRVAG
jgi:hypothetical protein